VRPENSKNHGGTLVEQTLLAAIRCQNCDEIRIGNLTSRVVARLIKFPVKAFALSAIAPRVYISMDDWSGPACSRGEPRAVSHLF